MKHLRPKVRALLCTNDILEQLISIPVTEIISYCGKADSVAPEEALHYLAEMYIDNCGVSTGLRSFADYCARFWIERFKHDVNSNRSSNFSTADSLCEILPLFSDRYTEEIDNFDVYSMSDVTLRDILVEELRNTSDEKTKIILCAGICDILPKIHNSRWLDDYKLNIIEDAIVNLKDKSLIQHRHSVDFSKYTSRCRLNTTKNETWRKIDLQPHGFTEKEIRHFEKLNMRLTKLQHDVMTQVRDITLNLQEQIAKGFHQYDSFNVEGIIYIEDMEEDIDSLLNILAQHATYTVITTNDGLTSEYINEFIAMENHWYHNWSGIFHRLECEHGLKLCRAFCEIFEESKVFTITDIMKITPEMMFSQVKIHI